MRKLLLVMVSLVGITAIEPRAGAAETRIVRDVVYGHKDGMALVFDVLRPAEPNGASILHLQSGGWYSGWRDPQEHLAGAAPLLSKGYTVFIVYHGSAPRYAVPDAVADVRRAVRAIRQRASEWSVQPDRLGVVGGSAGGHLTLMLATTGDDGDTQSADPVLREPSRIAAAVAYFPPTDLRGWTTNPPEVIKAIPGLKPPLTFEAAKEADVSPILHANAKTVPILMIHGDKDELVPIAHSRNMLEVLKKNQTPCELLEMPGASHTFSAQDYAKAVPASIAWFDKYLAAPGK